MQTKGDTDRLVLFGRYAANLAHYAPALAGRFACPVCLDVFREDDVLHDSLKVDVGHVYPEELGGRLVTLECRKCNGSLNLAGDNELVRHFKDWDAVRPDGSGRNVLRAKLLMPSGPVHVEVTSAGVRGHFARSNPAAFAEAVKAMVNGERVRAQSRPPNHGRLNLAFLHSAHLSLFRTFGYGYLLSAGGGWVRQRLVGATPLDPAPYMTTEVYAGSPIDGSHRLRCGKVTFGDGASCLCVVMPSADPRATCQLVLLPGPADGDVEAYQRGVDAYANRAFRGRCELFRDRPPRCLEASEYADRLLHLWAGMTEDDLDRTKLMFAVRAKIGETTARKMDVGPVAKRWGWSSTLAQRVLAGLVADDLLARAPKARHPHIVRLTPRALARFQSRHRSEHEPEDR